MVRVLESIVVIHEFETRSGKIKDYKIGICCLYAKHTSLRRKNKHLLARNQDNISKWCDMSIADCCFSELALYKSN